MKESRNQFRAGNVVPDEEVETIQSKDTLERCEFEDVHLSSYSSESSSQSAGTSLSDYVKVKLHKQSKGIKVGLALRVLHNGSVIVDHVLPQSLAANANIQRGQKLLYINSITCTGMKQTQLAALLSELKGTITLILKSSDLIMARFYKKSKRTNLGILFKNNHSGTTVVSNITAESPAFNSELRVGHEIVSINDIVCSGLGAGQMTALLSEVQGRIVITAKVTTEEILQSNEDGYDGLTSVGSSQEDSSADSFDSYSTWSTATLEKPKPRVVSIPLPPTVSAQHCIVV